MLKIQSKRIFAAIAAVAAIGTAGIYAGHSSADAFALTSSSVYQDAGKAYFESDYKYLDDQDSVFQSLTFEQAAYLFQQEGTYLILFGGSWCPNTTSIVDYVNYAAKEAGVETVYTLDFRLDGTNSDTHIRETDGNSANGAQYNYLYGELVSRYLTNLDDWVEYSSDRAAALTYTAADGTETTVGKVQVPFLFLYNKDNTVHNYEDKNDDRTIKTKPAEKDSEGNLKTYPIVYGFERMVYRKSGTKELYTSSGTQDESTLVSDYAEQLDGAIFSHIGNGDGQYTLSTFSDADYIRLSYNQKSGNEIFSADQTVNIRTLTYKQLLWLLDRDGDYLLFFGGSWSNTSRELIGEINDYAVKNGVIVYNFDFRLDGGYAEEYWNYSKNLDFSDENNVFAALYEEILTYLQSGSAAAFIAYEKNGDTPVLASANTKGDNGSEIYGVFTAYGEKTGLDVNNAGGTRSVYTLPRIAATLTGVVFVAVTLTAVIAVKKRKERKNK